MTEELKLSIEDLYTTFSAYPLKPSMQGCPCCTSNGDKEKIHTKPLRVLREEDLSRYAFKAMTTWGNREDFKHYLPRILELLATTDFIIDTFIVLGKLNYAQWKTWPTKEQNAIRNFLLAWWTDLIKHKPHFDKEAFVEIYKLIGNIDELLERWSIRFNDNSFKNLVDLVYNHYYDLVTTQTSFKELDHEAANILVEWIRKNTTMLENGFFHYEQTDKELADKISAALYMIETVK